jgi:hypothetical protein
MENVARRSFNQAFDDQKYQWFQKRMAEALGETPSFRLAETPVFISEEFKEKLIQAGDSVLDQLLSKEFNAYAEDVFKFGVPQVPNENPHTEFLQLDFGVCEDENGHLVPKLIELQGFASLYFFQHVLATSYKEVYGLDPKLTHLFGNKGEKEYVEILSQAILAGLPPENVVLMDLHPKKQNTRVDFWATARYLGIPVVDLSEVITDGKKLFYKNAHGQLKPIHRIYNRVIFDELQTLADNPFDFDWTQEWEVSWAGHPNWFSKISKHSMPFLKGEFVPETVLLSEWDQPVSSLPDYVLKPLFSFSGSGVVYDVKESDLLAVEQPDRFVLQRKQTYTPFLENKGGQEFSKGEIRLMYVWPMGWDRPQLLCNLLRLSKGQMVGVKYNQDKDWVGSSVGLFY